MVTQKQLCIQNPEAVSHTGLLLPKQDTQRSTIETKTLMMTLRHLTQSRGVLNQLSFSVGCPNLKFGAIDLTPSIIVWKRENNIILSEMQTFSNHELQPCKFNMFHHKLLCSEVMFIIIVQVEGISYMYPPMGLHRDL